MSVNLEEKIKKENEQLQKSESLLEKTVKKAMNFGRKPKNTQKKTAPKTSRQEMPEEKEAAIPKETVKKESSKRGIKEKIPAGKTVQQRKKGGRAKNKRSGGAKADRCEKTPAKSQPTGRKQNLPPSPRQEPERKKAPQRRAPSAGADHILAVWAKSAKTLQFMNRAAICLWWTAVLRSRRLICPEWTR